MLKEQYTGWFQELATICSRVGDQREVLNRIRELLQEHLDCDVVLLFVDMHDHCSISAPVALNAQFISQDLVLEESHPVLGKIKLSREIWQQTNAQESIYDDLASEICVPILTPEESLGCLYCGRRDPVPFSNEEIGELVSVAAFLALPLERGLWHHHILRLREQNQIWQSTYTALLEALPHATFLVDLKTDRIIDVNLMGAQMVSYQKEDLLGQAFSRVCFNLPEPSDPLRPRARQKVAILMQENEPVEMWGLREPLKTPLGELTLFMFFPLTLDAKTDSSPEWLQEYIAACSKANLSDNLQNGLAGPCQFLAAHFGATYTTVQELNSEGMFFLTAAYQSSEKSFLPPEQHIFAGLSEDIFPDIIQHKSPLFISNVQAEPLFKNWLPVAKKIGYQAIACLPLVWEGNCIGLLSLFFSQRREYNKEEQSKLRVMAGIFAFLLQNHHLKTGLDEMSQQLNIFGKLTQSVNALHLQDVVKTTAMELIQIVPFDFFCMTLLEEKHPEPQFYYLSSATFAANYPVKAKWTKIENSELGWIEMTAELAHEKTSESIQPKRLPFSMPAHTSMLVISRDNYLGNVALGRLNNKSFSRKERNILNQVAGLLATAITNARLYEQTHKTLREISVLDQVSRSISSSLEQDTICAQICQGLQQGLNVSLCKLIPISEDISPVDLFYWLPEIMQQFLSEVNIKQTLEAFKNESSPLVIDTPEKFGEIFCRQNLPLDAMDYFFPFVLCPIILENELAACLLNAWDRNHQIADHETRILATLSLQLQAALLNARLFERTITKAREMESFVSSVSHEFKTPINTIKNYAMLVLEESADSLAQDSKTALERIVINLNRMDQMIIDLLQFHRTTRFEKSLGNYPALQIIERALETLQDFIRESSATIQIQPDLPIIHVNEVAIALVFTNLLTNAIKYTPKSTKPLIYIGCQKSKNMFDFVVQDNGRGIDPKYHESIFELFRSIDSDASSSGIGLAMVKKIIQMHRGRIWVESLPGKGATFHFTLPSHNPRDRN